MRTSPHPIYEFRVQLFDLYCLGNSFEIQPRPEYSRRSVAEEPRKQDCEHSKLQPLAKK